MCKQEHLSWVRITLFLINPLSSIIAKHLSARQLILHRILHSVVHVCMYVCITLRNAIYMVSIIMKLQWCKKRHVAWWAGPQMYNLMIMSVHAQGLPCIFVTLEIYYTTCQYHLWHTHYLADTIARGCITDLSAGTSGITQTSPRAGRRTVEAQITHNIARVLTSWQLVSIGTCTLETGRAKGGNNTRASVLARLSRTRVHTLIVYDSVWHATNTGIVTPASLTMTTVGTLGVTAWTFLATPTSGHLGGDLKMLVEMTVG